MTAAKSMRGVALFALAFASIPTTALAAPPLRVLAEGDCPTRAQIESALLARGFQFDPSGAVVMTAPDLEGLTVRLEQSDGRLTFERHFVSQDCQALAEAIAVVIEAHYLEVDHPQDVPLGQASSNSSTGVSDQTSPSKAYQPPLPILWAPTTSGRLVPNPSSSNGMVARGSVALGTALTMPEARLTPLGEIGGGINWRQVGLSTDLALFGSLPTSSGSTPNRVRRWSGWGLIRVSFDRVFGGMARPWVGLGVEWARTRALDIEAAGTQSSLSPALSGGLTVVWPWSEIWAGQIDVNCLLLATRDAYVVKPDGEVGAGPRAACSTLLGIGWGRY